MIHLHLGLGRRQSPIVAVAAVVVMVILLLLVVMVVMLVSSGTRTPSIVEHETQPSLLR